MEISVVTLTMYMCSVWCANMFLSFNLSVFIPLKVVTGWWHPLKGGRNSTCLWEMPQPQFLRGSSGKSNEKSTPRYCSSKRDEWLLQAAKGYKEAERRYYQAPISTVIFCGNWAVSSWLKTKIVLEGHREKGVTGLWTLFLSILLHQATSSSLYLFFFFLTIPVHSIREPGFFNFNVICILFMRRRFRKHYLKALAVLGSHSSQFSVKA